MPELPEVETVRRGLSPVMQGEKIRLAEVNRAGLRWPFPADMAMRLSGKRVISLGRRSKYILVGLDSGETLIWHLGMSGRVLISLNDHPETQKHDHVVLNMENGARVTFNDVRRFGSMDLAETDRLQDHALLAGLGPEPLGNTFDGPYLSQRLKSRALPIKSALLDQRIVAGLGNIYVCEVLFRAGIRPQTKSAQLSAKRVAGLVPIIRDVLSEAITAGGSTLSDHRQTNGELGYFQHRFAVYGREGEPCLSKDCASSITRIVQSGRSSFYCPSCQS